MNATQRTPDVSELVRQALAGSSTARRLIVEQLSRRLRGIALSIVGNSADAEDATQSIFLELFQSLPSFKGDNLLPWADSIAVRTAVRHARSRRVRTARDASVDPEELVAEAQAPADHRVPRAIIEYLGELPETRRVALVLRHVMGYSVEEIAELTEVSPNTVKDRLHQARMQVRKTLRRELGLVPLGPRRNHE
ncbi:MAG: RNA polymerase sigma factor [Myxococcales bacterium]|nr:MAG: RNA polymerase sigma factor [Myxococcales bacterium]